MIEFSADRGFVRTWIGCEASDRWLNAVRRFAAEMMPQPLIPAILPAQREKARKMLSGNEPAVVLWEVRRDSLAATCDCLAQTAIAFPQVLQLVAGGGLSDREQIVLSEFRCAAAIRHPEDLPKLAGMVHGYFATSRHNLD